MRPLLGAGGLLKNCSYRLRWYGKEKTFLTPKELCDRAKNAIEARAKARRLAILSRLRPDDAKELDTPVLELLCRALATSSKSSSSNDKLNKTIPSDAQKAKCPSDQSSSNKTSNDPSNSPENLKQEPQTDKGKSDTPQTDKEKSGNLEIFNCKTCHENSSGEDIGTSNLKIENCKSSKSNGSVLKNDPSPSADSSKQPNKPPASDTPKEKSQQGSNKPDCPPGEAGNTGSGKNSQAKDNATGPQEKPPVKGAQGKAKEESQVKPPENYEEAAAIRGTGLKRSSCAEEDMESVPCPKPKEVEDCIEKQKMKEGEEKTPTKPPAKGSSQEGANSKKDESKTKSQAKPSQEDGAKPKEKQVQTDSPPVKNEIPPNADGCPETEVKSQDGSNKTIMMESTEKQAPPNGPVKESSKEGANVKKDECKTKSQAKPSQENGAKASEKKAKPDSPSGKKDNSPSADTPPSDSPFPPGKNPCKDSKQGDGEKSEGAEQKQIAGADKVLQPIPCPKLNEVQDSSNNQQIKEGEENKPPTTAPGKEPAQAGAIPKSNEDKTKSQEKTSQGGAEPKEKKAKPDSPPDKKDTSPSADPCKKSEEKNQGIKESKEQKTPTKPPSKGTAQEGANAKNYESKTESQAKPSQEDAAKPSEKKAKADYPSDSPFPPGKNPCKDGKQGDSEKSKGPDSSTGKKESPPNADPCKKTKEKNQESGNEQKMKESKEKAPTIPPGKGSAQESTESKIKSQSKPSQEKGTESKEKNAKTDSPPSKKENPPNADPCKKAKENNQGSGNEQKMKESKEKAPTKAPGKGTAQEGAIPKTAESKAKAQAKPSQEKGAESKEKNAMTDSPYGIQENPPKVEPCRKVKENNQGSSNEKKMKESKADKESKNKKAPTKPSGKETAQEGASPKNNEGKSQSKPSQEDGAKPKEKNAKTDSPPGKKESPPNTDPCKQTKEKNQGSSNEKKMKESKKDKESRENKASTKPPGKETAQEGAIPKTAESKTKSQTKPSQENGNKPHDKKVKTDSPPGNNENPPNEDPCKKAKEKNQGNSNEQKMKESNEKKAPTKPPGKGSSQEGADSKKDECKTKSQAKPSQEDAAKPKEKNAKADSFPGKKESPPNADPCKKTKEKNQGSSNEKKMKESKDDKEKKAPTKPTGKETAQESAISKSDICQTKSQAKASQEDGSKPPTAASQDAGRNPCRDGPRQGSDKEIKAEGKGSETNASGNHAKRKRALCEKALDVLKQLKAEAKEVCGKNGKAPMANEEIKASSGHPDKSTGSKPPEPVPTKPAKEAVKASDKVMSEAKKELDLVSCKEELLKPEASKKEITNAQKASASVPSKEGSKPIETSEKVLTEAKKASSASVSSKEESKHFEASQKVLTEAQKASSASVSSKEESKHPEASKKEQPETSKAELKQPEKKTPPTGEETSKDPQTSGKLKNFPAAPLGRTLTYYLESIEPLLGAEDFDKQKQLIKEFEKGEGQKLQKLLEEAADSCSNWLTPRWTQAVYLAYPAPVTAFTSPALSFPVQKFNDSTDCLLFTARAISAICEFKELVDQNKIPVAKMGDNDLDNSQFSHIFGTIRKPGRFCDSIEQFSDSDYVVVIYRNNFFQLPVRSSSGSPLSPDSLVADLEAIIDCPLERGEPLGLLTHDNRGNWAEARGAMCRLPGNADTLEAIEQSLFVVCMDRCVAIPEGQESIVQAHQLLHGGGLNENSANRWMDKTIQLIVNPNGLAGFCYEHSPAECQPLAMLMDYVMEKIKIEAECEPKPEPEKSNNESNSKPARHLRFHPADECLNIWLHCAMRNMDKIVSKLRMNVFEYECHGKEFIKAQGLNSDSYIQMALQLAYFKLHKTLPAQYESAHLRLFINGRTETIRSTSNESKTFVLSMNSEKFSEAQKLQALQNAVDVHEQLTKRALNGEGIDRHLFGLQQMALENNLKVPEFFKSKGYLRSVTFQLFTSQVATAHQSFMAYGPLTCDGYGCCYNPQNDKITFAISAWETSQGVNPVAYGKAIKKSLDTMRRLILKTGGDRVGEHPCNCEKILT